MGRLRVFGMLVAVALAVAACDAGTPPKSGSGLIEVVSTVSPITNIIQNIGGERVEVTGIVPEGSNSHTFEPAPSDARVLAAADIVFINGLHLEEPTKELAKSNVRSGVKIVELGPMTIMPDQYIYDFS